MSLIKRFMWSSLGLGLLLACLLFWLLGTQNGLRWAVAQASGIVQVGSIEGDASDLSFSGLILNIGEDVLTIDSGRLAWSPLLLVMGKAQIDDVYLGGLELELHESAAPQPGYTPWQGLHLPLDTVIKRASVQKFSITRGEQALAMLDSIEMSGQVSDDILYLDSLVASEADNKVSIIGEIDLSAQPEGNVDLRHKLDWQIDTMRLQSDGSITGRWSSLELELNQVSPLQAQLALTLNNVLADRMTWSGELLTAPIEQQAVMQETLSLGSGTFALGGEFSPALGLEGLTASVLGQISGGNNKFEQWTADANIKFKDNDLNIETLRLEQLGQAVPGVLSISGSIYDLSRFMEPSNVEGRVELSGRWLSLKWPLSGADTQVESSGRFTVEGASTGYRVLANASGLSHQRLLDCELDAVISGNNVDVKTLELISGDSSLTVAGKVGDNLDISWSLNSPSIDDFIRGASGALKGSGRVSGKQTRPKIMLTAVSSGLSWQAYAVENLDLRANVSLINENDLVDINLNADSIQANGQMLARHIDLSVKGKRKSHAIELGAILANKANLEANLQGNLLEKKWNGILSALSLNDPELAQWSLQENVAISVDSENVSMSPSCLNNGEQHLCFEIDARQSSSRIQVDIKSLDMANLNRFAGLYDLNVTGQANGQLSYLRQSGATSGLIDGYLESNGSVLTWQQTGDGDLLDESLVFDRIRAEINQTDSLTASLDFALAGSDKASVDLVVKSTIESDDFMRASSIAEASIQIADLSILPTVFLDAVSLNGGLSADMQLRGSLATPEITTTASLKDAQVDIPELGLELRGIQLTIDSAEASKVNISGKLSSGEGELGLGGNIDFANLKSPRLSLSLNGDSLKLADTEELKILGKVDLNVEIVDRVLDINGGISIHSADIDFKVPDSAIVVSGDVILEGAEQQDARLQQRIKVLVDLGENTHIRAQGLDADLLGGLLVFQEPGGILRGDGQITVNNGRYRAYGQDLKIDKGQLIFSGGSIDDPSLNLNAEKVVENIIAGVSVTGRASSPKLDLYSSPTMPDEDILSVLIFGKAVGNLESQDGLTLLRIANSLRGDGTSEVTKMTEKLQQSLGLTSLELQLSSDSPSIVAGKQFSSKFYVGYGYGLLDAAQSLILRYKLNKAWSIKADVGVDSGADLRYQVER